MSETERWTLAQYHAYLAHGTDLPQPPSFVTMDPEAPEDLLRSRLQTLCQTTGHLYYHARKSQGSTAGMVDFILCHPARQELLLWEAKTATGRVSAAQQRWMEALQHVTAVDARIIRPSDWAWIVDTLQHPRKEAP
jgi:hypothetical protein